MDDAKMVTKPRPTTLWYRVASRIGTLITSGSASIVATSIAANLLRLISSMTLTRLLDANQFGVVGIVTSVAVVFSMLADIGTQAFVIRHPEGNNPDFLDQIWTLRLIRSIALTLAMGILAFPIAMLMHKPVIGPVIAAWSLAFVLDGLSSMAFATAIRERMLWRLSLLDISGNFVQLIIGIPLAIWLRSYWAIILSMIIAAAFKVALSYYLFSGSARRIFFSRSRAKELWEFARVIGPSSYLTLIILQADKIFLGATLSLESFGLYTVAATLAASPTVLAWSYTRRVLYPIYAETARESPERLAEIFYGKRRAASIVFTFLTAATAGGSALIIALLYDPRYMGAAPILTWLCVSASLSLVNYAADELLISVGKIRATLHANIVRATWLAIGIIVAITFQKPLIMVPFFGLIEIPTMFFYWYGLKRLGVLNWRQEGLVLLVATFGGGVGLASATIILGLFPAL